MIVIKRILCPVDSSEFADRALRYAAALASWYRAELTALSVQSTILPASMWGDASPPSPLQDPAWHGASEQALRAFVSKAVGDVATKVVTTPGLVVPEILRTAAELPADLIVMGTHGLSGFERLLLGSVTERVLRKAPCPVLTVPRLANPDAGQPVTFKTIVCGIDFSLASEGALDYALSLALEAGGRLVLVHTFEWPEEDSRLSAHYNVPEYRRAVEQETQQSLDALVPDHARTWCVPEIILGYGKAYRELLRIATEKAADLIVLGVQGRGAVDLTLFGSTTAHVLREATCPVLTVGVKRSAERGR